LKIYSQVLGENIYFAPTDAVAEKLKHEGLPIYSAKELEHLARKGLKAEELKAIHETKKVFPGSKIVNLVH